MENVGRTWPTESIKQATQAYRGLNGYLCMVPIRSLHGSSVCILWPLPWYFYGTRESWSSASQPLMLALDFLLLPLGCFVQPWYQVVCIVLLYLALFYLVAVSWKETEGE